MWLLMTIARLYRSQPDVVHTNLSSVYLIPLLRRLLPNANFIHTIHNAASYETVARLKLLSHIAQYNEVRFVFLGEGILSQYRKEITFAKNPRTIPNGVPIEAPPIRKSGKAVTFLYVGSWRRPKRPDYVLLAFNHAFPDQENVQLVMVGRKEKLESQECMTILSRDPRIDAVGPHSDPTPYFRTADIFVHCSDSEADPLSIKEAMSFSLPVLASNVGAISAVVKDGTTGFLVEQGDWQALSRYMRYLFTNAEQRQVMGGNAHKLIAAEHSLAHMCHQYYGVYWNRA